MIISQKRFVGWGRGIPILGSEDTNLSTSHKHKFLNLTRVLHTPQIIKILIFVRQITTYNNIYVSFDTFGFSVNEFHMGILLMICDSLGDLFLVTTFYPLAGLDYSL